MRIEFVGATVTNCDYIGRTVWGVCAVVRDNAGNEVFRSRPSTKRFLPRQEAESFIAGLQSRVGVNSQP